MRLTFLVTSDDCEENVQILVDNDVLETAMACKVLQ